MRASLVASFAVMWAVPIASVAILTHYRRRLIAATLDLRQHQDQATRDAPLAAWCRHMRLSVVTHTGWEFTATLAEIQDSEAADVREWNLPIQVVLQSDILTNGVPLIKPIGEPFPGFPRG